LILQEFPHDRESFGRSGADCEGRGRVTLVQIPPRGQRHRICGSRVAPRLAACGDDLPGSTVSPEAK
jgi:hypothetical protein